MSALILTKNASWALLYHVFSRGSHMLAAIFLARGLDVPSFASFGYFQLTVYMLAAYASMGLGAAASRFFAEARHQVTAHHEELLGNLCVLSIALATVAFVVVLWLPEVLIGAGLSVPSWIMALGVLVLVLQVVSSGAIMGLERYRQGTGIAVLSGAVILTAAIAAVHLQDVRVAMWGIIASLLFQLIAESLDVVRTLKWWCVLESIRPRVAHIKRVANLSGPMFLVSLMSASAGWLVGRVILSGPGGQHAFALFTIGLQWFALGLVLPGVFSRVLLPLLLTRDVTATSVDEPYRDLVRVTALLAVGAATAIAIVGTLFGPWILTLYGSNYQAGRWLIAAFLVAAVFSAPTNTLGSALLARDGQWAWLGLTTIWLVILLCLAFVLRDEPVWAGPVTYAGAHAALSVGALLVARRRSLV